jgi:hypothetical protein
MNAFIETNQFSMESVDLSTIVHGAGHGWCYSTMTTVCLLRTP